jgi:hypothetical protein
MVVSNWGGNMGDGVDSYGKWWSWASQAQRQPTRSPGYACCRLSGFFALTVTFPLLPVAING